MVSVIIPVYNEEESISECIASLLEQDYKNLEIIIVDDGSTDKTKGIVNSFKVKLLNQKHKGPGSARNLGALRAKGEILVFVDADMTFEKSFISDLVAPIEKGESIGTFSKNEMVKNVSNLYSRSWNINRNLPYQRMIPDNYPSYAPVFRAILKKEFEKVEGFDLSGEYTDDWSLSKKLGVQSTLASGATYYHVNPSSAKEVWKQARWIGRNYFISGTLLRRLRSIILYSFPFSLSLGIYKSLKYRNLFFLIFKPFYDLAIWISIWQSFYSKKKSK